MMKIILASQSERRSDILRALGIPFSVSLPGVDESALTRGAPEDTAVALARAKCADVLGRHGVENTLVVAADTVVSLGGEILGKPKDPEDALRMLLALSGRTHTVYTGVAVGSRDRVESACGGARVTFRPFSARDAERYIKTAEPMDKAGAYGIQGKGACLVEKIEGDYFGVVGLPVSSLVELLRRFGTDIWDLAGQA